MKTGLYVKSDDVITFPIHGGVSLHNLEDDTFFSLEEGTASYIWDQLDGSKSLGEIIKEVVDTYNVPVETVASDMNEFTEMLLENNLIRKVESKI